MTTIASDVLGRWRRDMASKFPPDRVDSFIARHRGLIEDMIERKLARRPWFSIFNERGGVPRDEMPGYRRARDVARGLFAWCSLLIEEAPADLDLRPALEYLGSTRGSWDGDEFDDDPSVLAAELPDLVGTSAMFWSPEETGDLLVDVMEARDGIRTAKEVEDAIADRIWSDERRLELRSIDKVTACEFIRLHHSALPACNPRGMMYAIGAFIQGEMIAAATAGTPTGRWGESGCPADGTLELTRIASIRGLTRVDRRGRTVPINASSALASRLMDLLPASGRNGVVGCRFVTYSLTTERASTYLALVAKGLRPVALRRGVPPSGARSASEHSLADADKIVWEAGQAARPPHWALVPPERRGGAIRAFDAFSEVNRK